MKASEILCALCVALIVVGLAIDAHAHTRSASHSVWRLDERGATVQARLTALDFSVLQATGAASDPEGTLTGALRLGSSSGECGVVPGSFMALSSSPESRRFEWRVNCEGVAARHIHSDLLFEPVPTHLHFATALIVGSAAPPIEQVLSRDARRLVLPEAGQSQGESLLERGGRYVWLGVIHILTGWDHLVFLWMLVVVATSLRALALVVTGFTLGHSITLSLAVLGFTRVEVSAVEALIGLSIALLAVEGVWLRRAKGERDDRLPVAVVSLIGVCALASVWVGGGGLWLALVGVGLFAGCYFGLMARREKPEALRGLVAGLFGLVHGFGFAGVLQALTPRGAEGTQLALPLFTFNLGVELGQLMVIALVWPLLVLARRKGLQDGLVVWSGVVGVGLGVYWFVWRTLG